MGLFDNCLLACDIDGTLVENGNINPKNVEAVEYFIREGGYFSLSTGRAVCAISDVLNSLKRISPSVLANGCMIYDYENNKSLYEIAVPKQDYRIAELVINSGINVGAEIHCGADAFTLRRSPATDLHQIYEKFTAPDISFKEISKRVWNKVIYIFETAEDREIIKKLVQNEKTDCDFLETCAIINGVKQNYFEQVPKGVSKASALKRLCEILEVKAGGLFAIGDYYNDVEMLSLADTSAVPCDSPKPVKDLANYITCPCIDGAVADFINYLSININKQ